MTRSRVMRISLVILVLAFIASAAQAQIGAVVSNWTVPSSNSSSSSGLHHSQALADVTQGLAFIGVTPCRIVDTRGPVGPYGGPSLPAASPRSFALAGGPCAGLPSVVVAYSLNITVTNTLGPGFISLYPTGGSAPLVSTLNYVGGQTIANAAIVPAGTGSAVTAVAGVSGTDLIIDINGYYMGGGFGAPLNPGEFVGFVGNYSSGGVLYAGNSSATATATTCSVRGNMTTTANGPSAILGEMFATTGLNFAVRGNNASTTNSAAAVYGNLGAASEANSFVTAAGVLGRATGATFTTGVRGEGLTEGLLGIRVDGSGVTQTYGFVGSAGSDGFFTPNNLTVSGTKSFVEPSSVDPTKVIKYVALEGGEAGTYFRGKAVFQRGLATITIPADFREVTDPASLSVQITPIGEMATVAVVRIDPDAIVVKASRSVEFFYMVNGVRKAFNNWQPIQPDSDHYFSPMTADSKLQSFYPAEIQKRLISNGTYNPDGSVNLETAKKVGWEAEWREREERVKAEAASRPVRQPSNN
jgi:hypothetical protein